MKASELMLGDYVLYEEKVKKVGVIWNVHSVSLTDCPPKTWGSIYVDKYETKELQPLPITPEILLNNGWVLAGAHYVLKAKEARLGWQPYGEFILGYALFPKKVLYLHELQHIMRDCGIEATFKL